LAGVLSFFVIGTGQIYNKQYPKGFLLFVLGLIFSYGAFSNPFENWFFIVGWVCPWIYSITDAEKTAKKTIRKQPNKYAIRIVVAVYILLFTVGFITGLISGWVSTYTGETSQILDYYNKHVSLIAEDEDKILLLYGNWVDTYNDAIEDNRLTREEVSDIGITIDEYVLQYKLAKNHLENFKKLFYQNEDYLKSYTTVDTFEVQTMITDYETSLDYNLNYIRGKTEDLEDSYQQYNEQFLQYLTLLTLV